MKPQLTIQELETKAHWNTHEVAFYISCSYRTFYRRVRHLPDFPKPYRVPMPTGGYGKPKWKPEEIKAWYEKQKEPKAA